MSPEQSVAVTSICTSAVVTPPEQLAEGPGIVRLILETSLQVELRLGIDAGVRTNRPGDREDVTVWVGGVQRIQRNDDHPGQDWQLVQLP